MFVVLGEMSKVQVYYRRALLCLLQSGIESWMRSCLSQLLPSSSAPSRTNMSSLSSSPSDIRATNPIFLASTTDKEFVVSFLYHSWPLLAHNNPEISTKTQECWRIIKMLNSGQDVLTLVTLEDLIIKAERHLKTSRHRERRQSEDGSTENAGDQQSHKEEEEEWVKKVKPEQLEEILLGESISHFVRRAEDAEAHAKGRWLKGRQEARKKKAMR